MIISKFNLANYFCNTLCKYIIYSFFFFFAPQTFARVSGSSKGGEPPNTDPRPPQLPALNIFTNDLPWCYGSPSKIYRSAPNPQQKIIGAASGKNTNQLSCIFKWLKQYSKPKLWCWKLVDLWASEVSLNYHGLGDVIQLYWNHRTIQI